MAGPLLFGVLVGLAVVIGFVALWRTVRVQDPVAERLAEYGVSEGGTTDASSGASRALLRPAWPGITRLLAGFGFGPRLASDLARADVPLTAAEFALIMLGVGVAGTVIGALRMGLGLGLVLGMVCGLLPLFYVRYRGGRRSRAFTEQLPDVLTLLVGGLRAGFGLLQGLATLVEQVPPPAGPEFGRVMRAVELGLPVERALEEMATRIDSDDLSLVVTAITVQHEMGGNLAQTLEIIGETVRDRIRMLREIRVMTAQQRFTGYVLAFLPIAFVLLASFLNRDYIQTLLQPGLVRVIAMVAVGLQIIGFLIIRRIVDIEV